METLRGKERNRCVESRASPSKSCGIDRQLSKVDTEGTRQNREDLVDEKLGPVNVEGRSKILRLGGLML